ncbi:MAG: dockerin type I repeat-containing protein [Clostridia bacterium]|nr:dockerin type I repeat-containing protein [Clostridia bacterium]
MKKILALILALAMTAAIVPAAFAVGTDDVSVTYTGATVDATGVAVGGTFYWTLSVSEHSQLFSGHWLIDYPEEYFTPTAQSTTWSGGLTSMINATWDDENAWSDKASFVCNMEYEGGTGTNPVGEAGNMYSTVGMYLTTFDFWGVQMGGPFVRIKYRIDAQPPANLAQHDSAGYYLEIPVTVLESKYFVEGSVIAPGQDYSHDHESIDVINGKVYVNPSSAVTLHTVTFYDIDGNVISTQQVQDGGAATAPSIPETVNNANGTYIFYGWDVDFSNVTGDIDVHPEYVLLGDTDLNGTVTSADALLALRYTMNVVGLTDKQIFAGNVDHASGLTSADALKILRYVMGVITTLA